MKLDPDSSLKRTTFLHYMKSHSVSIRWLLVTAAVVVIVRSLLSGIEYFFKLPLRPELDSEVRLLFAFWGTALLYSTAFLFPLIFYRLAQGRLTVTWAKQIFLFETIALSSYGLLDGIYRLFIHRGELTHLLQMHHKLWSHIIG